MKYDYDLIVIGAGSGGVRASRISAGFGAKVAIAEEHRIGGTCVIRGCIPKKYLVYASHFSEELDIAQDYGWHIENKSFNWQTLIERKDQEIDRLNKLYIQTLEKAGVTMIQGRAVLTGPNSVQVGNKNYTAERILIAVGGWPHMPDVSGIEHAISSNEALHLEQLPETIAIVGGGYIAVEFAGIFAGLGSKVTLIYRGKQILRGFDEDLSHRLTKEMRAKGIDVRTETNIDVIKKSDHSTQLTLTDGTELIVGTVMYATGRKPIGIGAVSVPDRSPATPPGMRVRTGRFEKLRS